MRRGESLTNLYAPPVPVHIAESAHVHKNVEAKLLSCAESALHLIMTPAMTQAEVDDLAPPVIANTLHRFANLPVRIMAVLVEQSRRQLHFEGLILQQVDCLRTGDRRIAHQI